MTATAAKTVLVVEDEESVRSPLVNALKYRGFKAEGAANVPETRRLIDKLGQDIDVAVLDMNLQDQNHPTLTGADLGREVRKAHPELPPEFLVFSGHREPDYYDAALQLGIAAYLVKGSLRQEDLIRHIRSLALRRALNTEREEIAEKIERIAEKYNSSANAIVNLCRQVLEPEMRACLGVLPIFLLSDKKGTQNCSTDVGLPVGYSSAYERIQGLTFAAVNNNGPFIFNKANLGIREESQETEIFGRLDGSRFLPLHSAQNLKLSVGILQAESTSNSIPEEPDKLAAILWTYLRQPIEELLNLLSRMEAAIEKAKRVTLLKHTSRFCLYVGQAQLDVLHEAVEENEIESGKPYFQKLKKLALDLKATGTEFSHLATLGETGQDVSEPSKPISALSVIHEAKKQVEEQFTFERLRIDTESKDFELTIDRDDLLVAVLRVMQWMAQREDKTPPDIIAPTLNVVFAESNGRREIHFSDQSRRLNSQLRQKLFEPFTESASRTVLTNEDKEEWPGLYLPLYLAKMLIEVKNNGFLEDRSDQLESKSGHRFVMSFPIGEVESRSHL